jgi:lipoyl-dependent peroxiredoxin subunit D
MENINTLRESLPDFARDIKLNIQNVLGMTTLTPAQIWGVAVAAAYTAKNEKLIGALLLDAKSAGVEDGVIEDAKASALLMSMNNVYYRFRHVMEKEDYEQKPARLRMSRLVQVTSNKTDFELFSLCVSAINNCVACMKAHEKVVLEHEMTTDQVHDAIRIAATVNAMAMALSM